MSLYEPLHVRSAFSLGRGTAPVAALAEQAALYGHRALALTDRNNLYGAIPFIEACGDWGVRPILGAEVDEPGGGPVVVLLVRDRRGYHGLCRILTRRMLDPGFRLLPVLEELHAGLFVLVSDPRLLLDLAGRIPRESLRGELTAPGHGEPDFREVCAAAETAGVATVATGDVGLRARDEHALHVTLTAIRENTVTGRLGREDVVHPEAYFKAPAAMASCFRHHRAALTESRRIADACRYVPRRERWIFPELPLPPGQTASGYLLGLCRDGMRRRYRAEPRAATLRLERELGIIDTLGFTDYFVIVGEICRFAREQGIATVGRGSGAGALTAYLLGITNVDPLRYGLYFERFLHEKRPDCPDLDIDLCWKRRDEVIEHVYETYGRDRVAMISTHNAFRPRSAFREAARAHGVAHATVNRLSRAVPHGLEGPLGAALRASPLAREVDLGRAPWPRVLADADRLLGLPRHLGLHPGGMVIADRPLDHYVPLEEATKGILCTQFEMRAVEAVGLVKMDLLGNRALSTIQETVDLVERGTGRRLDPDAFPDPDPAVAAMFQAGDTLGVFQMESPGMRNLNRMLRTGDLATTIAAVALIRPGPAGSGMKERFVRRARGLEPVTYVDRRLEPLLRETFGVPLYEEDVMCVAAEVAGLSREDGDVLRRALAGAGEAERSAIEQVFLAQARRRGYSAAASGDIWRNLLQFGSFAFCKAHAAGYGVLAWQAGWLKAHHPVEFTAALMNHHAGMYDKRVHLEDARRRGVRALLPDANRSGDGFTVEGQAVRVGLERIRGLSAATRGAVLAARARRPFVDLEDFLARVPAARPEVEAMVLAGAFDFVSRTRPELLCLVASGFETFRAGRHRDAPWGGEDLFVAEAPRRVSWGLPSLPEFTEAQRLWLEWHVLGLCVGRHPMEIFRADGLPEGTCTAREAEASGGRRIRVAGMVAALRTVPTRSGRRMQFVTLEDETGLVECTLFPEAWARHRGQVRGLGPFAAQGRIEDQYGALTLNTERITVLPLPRALREAERHRPRAGEGSRDQFSATYPGHFR